MQEHIRNINYLINSKEFILLNKIGQSIKNEKLKFDLLSVFDDLIK